MARGREESYVRANRSIASRLFNREKNAFYRTTAEHLDLHQVQTRFKLMSSLYNDVLRKHEKLMEILHNKHDTNSNGNSSNSNNIDNKSGNASNDSHLSKHFSDEVSKSVDSTNEGTNNNHFDNIFNSDEIVAENRSPYNSNHIDISSTISKEEQWIEEYERGFERVEHRRYAIEKQILDAKARSDELKRQAEEAKARKREAQTELLKAHQLRIVEDRTFYFFAQTLETVMGAFHHCEENIRFMKEDLRRSFERCRDAHSNYISNLMGEDISREINWIKRIQDRYIHLTTEIGRLLPEDANEQEHLYYEYNAATPDGRLTSLTMSSQKRLTYGLDKDDYVFWNINNMQHFLSTNTTIFAGDTIEARPNVFPKSLPAKVNLSNPTVVLHCRVHTDGRFFPDGLSIVKKTGVPLRTLESSLAMLLDFPNDACVDAISAKNEKFFQNQKSQRKCSKTKKKPQRERGKKHKQDKRGLHNQNSKKYQRNEQHVTNLGPQSYFMFFKDTIQTYLRSKARPECIEESSFGHSMIKRYHQLQDNINDPFDEQHLSPNCPDTVVHSSIASSGEIKESLDKSYRFNFQSYLKEIENNLIYEEIPATSSAGNNLNAGYSSSLVHSSGCESNRHECSRLIVSQTQQSINKRIEGDQTHSEENDDSQPVEHFAGNHFGNDATEQTDIARHSFPQHDVECEAIYEAEQPKQKAVEHDARCSENLDSDSLKLEVEIEVINESSPSERTEENDTKKVQEMSDTQAIKNKAETQENVKIAQENPMNRQKMAEATLSFENTGEKKSNSSKMISLSSSCGEELSENNREWNTVRDEKTDSLISNLEHSDNSAEQTKHGEKSDCLQIMKNDIINSSDTSSGDNFVQQPLKISSIEQSDYISAEQTNEDSSYHNTMETEPEEAEDDIVVEQIREENASTQKTYSISCIIPSDTSIFCSTALITHKSPSINLIGSLISIENLYGAPKAFLQHTLYPEYIYGPNRQYPSKEVECYNWKTSQNIQQPLCRNNLDLYEDCSEEPQALVKIGENADHILPCHISSIIKDIENMKPIKDSDLLGFIGLVDTVTRIVHDLSRFQDQEVKNETGAWTYIETIAIETIEELLPLNMKMKWKAKVNETNNCNVTFAKLMDFLVNQRNILEHLLDGWNNSTNANVTTSHSRSTGPRMYSSGARLHYRERKCLMCQRYDHMIDMCGSYLGLSADERLNFLQGYEACLNCLRIGHMTNQCSSDVKCDVESCRQNHHVSLHDALYNDVNNDGDELENIDIMCTSTYIGSPLTTSLQIMRVRTRCLNPDSVTMIWDCEAKVSFITYTCAKRLRLVGKPTAVSLSGDNHEDMTDSFKYLLPLVDSLGKTTFFKVHGVGKISTPVSNVNFSRIAYLFPNTNMSPMISSSTPDIDVCVGANYAGYHPTKERSVGNLQLMKNSFGYCIGGDYFSL